MARFRYSMQSILNIKMKMETQAKQEFSAARAELDREEALLAQLHERRQEYEAEGKRLLSGTLDFLKIEENKMAVLHMGEKIAAQTLNVRKAEEKLEQTRERLREVMTDRKTHETLRQKAFEEFLMEEKRAESKEIDQLTSYTYGQRRSGEQGSGATVV